MKIGDLVQKTYGEGQRPVAIVVGFYKDVHPGSLVQIRWLGDTKVSEIGSKYLEVISENR